MPLLSFLSGGKKQQKVQQTPVQAVGHEQSPARGQPARQPTGSSSSEDYVGVERHTPALANGGEEYTSRLRLPFRRKNKSSTAGSDVGHGDAVSQRTSVAPVLPPPARTSVFSSFSLSTQSLPMPDLGSSSLALPSPNNSRPTSLTSTEALKSQSERAAGGKKRSSVFGFGNSRDATQPVSKTTPSTPVGNDADSFNLRAFRHVNATPGQTPTVDLSPPTTPTYPHPPRKPREDSTASDSSGMKVSDFRARTRKSSTSLPLSTSPRASVDLGRAQVLSQQSYSSPVNTQPTRPPALNTPKSTPAVRQVAGTPPRAETSSEEEEEEEEDSEDNLPLGVAAARNRGTAKLTRDSTITKRTRSEVGHGASAQQHPPSSDPPRPSLPSSRSESGHSSTSSQTWRQTQQPMPMPTSQNEEARGRPGPSMLANPSSRAAMAQSARSKSRNAASDTSEDESDSHRHGPSDSDDTAPLGKLVPPKRPGSALSMASASSRGGSPARRAPAMPLVDVNAPSNMNQPPPLPKNMRSYARPRAESESRQSQASTLLSPLPSPLPTSSPATALGDRPPQPVLDNARAADVFVHLDLAEFIDPGPSASAPRPASGILKAPSPHFATSNPGSRSNSPSRLSGSPNSSAFLSPSSNPPRPLFTRNQSPASSTGSSSSRAPPTPGDSDLSSAGRYSGTNSVVTDASGESLPKPRRLDAHGRRVSVTFEEPEKVVRGRPGANVPSMPSPKKSEAKRATNVNEEDARKERRRSEAMAAIELGNAIHGPPPVLDDDNGLDMSNGLGAMPVNFNPALFQPGAFGMPGQMFTPGVQMPPGFMLQTPPVMQPQPGQMDPAFFAAHQQAMMAAKQAYQIAVAQQALAAAGDEWERSSNAGSWKGSMPSMGMSMPGMGMQMPGMGMPGMQMMPMMYPGMPMMPAAPSSMYGGSTGSGGRPGMWGGSSSVYGESFGPSVNERDRRRQSSMGGMLPFPSSSSTTQLDKIPNRSSRNLNSRDSVRKLDRRRRQRRRMGRRHSPTVRFLAHRL
ncbi:hypothetical protein BKA62DRAFT_767230 [Auriculariales sp. MPI-PUGE-AT-0066]|nr:hypothetical protein BKA62DRAFT_767230 [Auriculariales sp. MPI-PUGE-AT-0066]